jgi:hypothetical protein
VTNERVVTTLNRAMNERDNDSNADYANLLGFLSQFDRWLFETSKHSLPDPFVSTGQSTESSMATPYALLQADGTPCFFLRCKTWPFP